jgi:hypothetical protein
MIIPFCERPTCTIAEACAASGLGRTKIYQTMADGRRWRRPEWEAA